MLCALAIVRRISNSGTLSIEDGYLSRMCYSILIVDDDAQLRGICRTILEEAGWLAFEASNGKEALAAIETTSFDLILLDLCMPDIDGLEFLMAVRPKLPKLKIIAMSGFIDGVMLRAAKMFGAAAIIDKPFSTDLLISNVRDVLAVKDSVTLS